MSLEKRWFNVKTRRTVTSGYRVHAFDESDATEQYRKREFVDYHDYDVLSEDVISVEPFKS